MRGRSVALVSRPGMDAELLLLASLGFCIRKWTRAWNQGWKGIEYVTGPGHGACLVRLIFPLL